MQIFINEILFPKSFINNHALFKENLDTTHTQDWDLPCELMVRAKAVCEDRVNWTLFLCPHLLSVVSQSEKLFWQLQPIFNLKLNSFPSFLLRIHLSCTMFQFCTWLWVTWQLCQTPRRERIHSPSAPLHLQAGCTLSTWNSKHQLVSQRAFSGCFLAIARSTLFWLANVKLLITVESPKPPTGLEHTKFLSAVWRTSGHGFSVTGRYLQSLFFMLPLLADINEIHVLSLQSHSSFLPLFWKLRDTLILSKGYIYLVGWIWAHSFSFPSTDHHILTSVYNHFRSFYREKPESLLLNTIPVSAFSFFDTECWLQKKKTKI